jgi:bifunctional non-homologous end joining protein LigD
MPWPIVFDLLFLDGQDLRAQPLSERRKALEALVGKGEGAILLSEQVAIKTVSQHGLEGIVSKRIDLPYRSGKRADWLEVKNVQADTFVIVGYMPDSHFRIAHLMLATEEDGELRYVGAVGTGSSEADGLALKKQLDTFSMPEAPVAGVKAKGAAWDLSELARPHSLSRLDWAAAAGFVQGVARRGLGWVSHDNQRDHT